jgi:hypothetical protein
LDRFFAMPRQLPTFAPQLHDSEEGAMGSMVLVGTIVGGVGLAVLMARWSLRALVEAMPERKKS